MIMPASRSPQQTGDGIAAIPLPGIVASRHMMALKRSIESEAKEICGSGMAGSRYRRYASAGHAPDYQRQRSELKDGHSLLPSSLPKVFLLLPGKQTPSDAIALVKTLFTRCVVNLPRSLPNTMSPSRGRRGLSRYQSLQGRFIRAVTQPPQKNARVTKLLFETPVLLGILRGHLQVRRRPPLWPEPARRPWPSSNSRCR